MHARVGDEVGDGPAHQLDIHLHLNRSGLDSRLEAVSVLVGNRLEAAADPLEVTGEVRPLELAVVFGVLRGGVLPERLHHRGCHLCLSAKRLGIRGRPIGRNHPVAKSLRVAADHRERRLDIVRDIGDHTLLLRLRALEALRQVDETVVNGNELGGDLLGLRLHPVRRAVFLDRVHQGPRRRADEARLDDKEHDGRHRNHWYEGEHDALRLREDAVVVGTVYYRNRLDDDPRLPLVVNPLRAADHVLSLPQDHVKRVIVTTGIVYRGGGDIGELDDTVQETELLRGDRRAISEDRALDDIEVVVDEGISHDSLETRVIVTAEP